MSRAHRRRLRHDIHYAIPRYFNGRIIYCTNGTFKNLVKALKNPWLNGPNKLLEFDDGAVVMSFMGIPIRNVLKIPE